MKRVAAAAVLAIAVAEFVPRPGVAASAVADAFLRGRSRRSHGHASRFARNRSHPLRSRPSFLAASIHACFSAAVTRTRMSSCFRSLCDLRRFETTEATVGTLQERARRIDQAADSSIRKRSRLSDDGPASDVLDFDEHRFGEVLGRRSLASSAMSVPPEAPPETVDPRASNAVCARRLLGHRLLVIPTAAGKPFPGTPCTSTATCTDARSPWWLPRIGAHRERHGQGRPAARKACRRSDRR